MTGPCNWPAATCPSCDGQDCLSASMRAELVAWAIHDLWAATGRVYGTCEVTVLPCNDYGTLCGSCYDSWRSCGCGSVSEIKLPGPVASVTEVVIDNVTLDPSAYRIDDYQWLVRLDGGVWPSGSDPTDPTGFAVTYEQGIEPPPGAGIVTGILVCSRGSCDNGSCKVPKGTQSLSRQGVTMIRNLDGQFGIPDVDDWVRNANAPLMAGAVHSPDLPMVRQITWEAPVSP